MNHRNIFGSSSKVFGNLRKSSDIFGNFRKFSENVRERSSGLRDNFDSGRKSSENHQKRRYQYVYIIKRTLHVSSKIWILCYSWQEQCLTRSLRSLVRYCSCHSNIKFISSCHRVISSISYSMRCKKVGRVFCNLTSVQMDNNFQGMVTAGNICCRFLQYRVQILLFVATLIVVRCWKIFWTTTKIQKLKLLI